MPILCRGRASMDSIRLSAQDRKGLLEIYRHGDDPRARLRCHILLLFDDGLPWATIASVLFTSPATIARVKRDFLRRGASAAFGRPGGRPPLAAALAAL